MIVYFYTVSQLTNEFFLRIRPIQLPDEIRLGSNYDGGYVVPRSTVNLTQSLISFGYGHDSNFERAFLRLSSNSKCFLFESSITFHSIARNLFRALASKMKGRRSFPAFYLKCLIRYLQMKGTRRLVYLAKEVKAEKRSKNQVGISEVMKSYAVPGGTFIKMDIEGGEYEILASQSFKDVTAMVIEFHQISSKIKDFLFLTEKLKEIFYISHFHINNFSQVHNGIPDVMEMTFVNRNIIQVESNLTWKVSLPINLDSPCDYRVKDEEILFT